MKKTVSMVIALIMLFSFSFIASAKEEKPFENSEFYSFRDYTLHYRTYVPEKEVKNNILLIHGFCLSTASFEGLAEQYCKEGYFVVTVDVPSFGYSSRENNETVLEEREKVIYSLVEYLGGTWIVGGHSMGGGIAINLACDYPETFTGLVLFAPQTSAQVSGIAGNLMGSSLMQKIYNLILKVALNMPSVVRSLVATSFSDEEYAKQYDLSRISDPLSLEGTGAGIAIMASHTRGTDFEKVSQLRIPVVIITAKNDEVASADNLNRIKEAFGENATVYECEYGGHMMMEYDPIFAAEKTLPVIELCR